MDKTSELSKVSILGSRPENTDFFTKANLIKHQCVMKFIH